MKHTVHVHELVLKMTSQWHHNDITAQRIQSTMSHATSDKFAWLGLFACVLRTAYLRVTAARVFINDLNVSHAVIGETTAVHHSNPHKHTIPTSTIQLTDKNCRQKRPHLRCYIYLRQYLVSMATPTLLHHPTYAPSSNRHPVCIHVHVCLKFGHADHHHLASVITEGDCHALHARPQVEVTFVGQSLYSWGGRLDSCRQRKGW